MKPATKNVDVHIPLTQDDRLELSASMNNLLKQIDDKIAEKKQAVKEFNADISELDLQRREISRTLDNGYIVETHVCFVRYNKHTGHQEYYNVTGDMIKSEPITFEDRQLSLLDEMERKHPLPDFEQAELQSVAQMRFHELYREECFESPDQVTGPASVRRLMDLRTLVVAKTVARMYEAGDLKEDEVTFDVAYDQVEQWFLEFAAALQREIEDDAKHDQTMNPPTSPAADTPPDSTDQPPRSKSRRSKNKPEEPGPEAGSSEPTHE